MKYHSILALFFVLILSACTERVPKPKPFLSEKKMVELLTEMHLLEVALQQVQHSNPHLSLDSLQSYTITAYNELFEKHGLNQESFEANLYYHTYYSRNLENIYVKIHDATQQIGEQNQQTQSEPE